MMLPPNWFAQPQASVLAQSPSVTHWSTLQVWFRQKRYKLEPPSLVQSESVAQLTAPPSGGETSRVVGQATAWAR
jgi:hypothetical protein